MDEVHGVKSVILIRPYNMERPLVANLNIMPMPKSSLVQIKAESAYENAG